MSTSVFLDTTIIIERIFEEPARRQEIERALGRRLAMTADYVLMEFKRAVLRTCVLLYSLAREAGSLQALFRRLSRLRTYEHRLANRYSLLLAWISREAQLEWNEVIERLEMLIEWQLLREFDAVVDEVYPCLDCRLARVEPIRGDDYYLLDMKCRREIVQCEIVDFVIGHHKELSVIAQALAEIEDVALMRVKEVIEEVLEEPSKARGRKNCWALGDVFVALCAPKDSPIYTTNRRHFEPICAALSKKLL
jgi:hypothetical protein